MFVKGKRKEEKGKMFVVQSRFSLLASRFFLFFLFVFLCTSVQASIYVATSPNNRLAIEVVVDDTVMNYSVSYDDMLVIHRGQIGYNVKNSTELREWYVDESAHPKTEVIRETWTPVHGYKSEYPNNATLVSIPLRTYTGKKMMLQIRAADEGVAFRCILSKGFGGAEEYVLDRELTTFPFARDFDCYQTSSVKGAYDIRPMSLCTKMHPATVVEVEKNKLYVAITEAGNSAPFPPMVLSPVHMQRGQLQASFSKGEVKVSDKITTPWRVIMIADNPGKFVENAYLVQNLNEPSVIKDVSWIKVGKVTRNASHQRSDSDKWVDYNVVNNYQAVLWESGLNSQRYQVVPNVPVKVENNQELLESIKYAHSKGQKFFLRCTPSELKKSSLDEMFKTYKQWGVDGLKLCSVDCENSQDVTWLSDVVKKAAEYRLMIDIHDGYRPTGWERTYPNIVSVGGLADNECRDSVNARPRSRVTMAFIRPINGMADFTPCFLDERVKSRAFQLACGLIFFNPLQHLHWYDKPLESNQTKYPELKFWSDMPTTWDDTKVIDGALGEYIVIARRKGNKWFVSAITTEARTLDIPLKFLNDGLGEDFRQFNARVYREDPEHPLQCRIENRTVNAIYTLHAVMTDGGGYNVIFTPEDE